MLKIYNTLTRTKEPLQPIEAGTVRMYVCGMTVYDYCHLGHARVLVVFDVVARYLRAAGYRLTYVRNITDIDDKIINRANELGVGTHELTARFIAAMHEDASVLGVLPPDLEPRATESIPEIVAMIDALVAKGYAYRATTGDVLYRVARFADYGRLSGKQLSELRAGERVAVDAAKEDPLDFVLWKAAKPGEPSWDSPWGLGRPGWHIECSAMSTACLGHHFDIHGGGMDLQFPHHENEIAQSEAATGEPFVNVWMHNGFVRVDDEKMSKSLGNFSTVREVLEQYRPEEVRYFILSSHYRSPLNYSDAQLGQARGALTRLYTALRDAPAPAAGAAPVTVSDAYAEHFHAAMQDDFNTPEALAVLFDLARELNRARLDTPEHAVGLAATMRELGATLGLRQDPPDSYLRAVPGATGTAGGGLSDAKVEALLAARAEARVARDWAEADAIRDQLRAQGVELEDGAAGTRWRRV